ncbi:MAG TPA: prolyl oligopeptidase family serine peptidase [Gemmatimonadales bacterium]|nr:prolyl oligopeptidase family serine peptidase [Gemmatimonadales bacterium]
MRGILTVTFPLVLAPLSLAAQRPLDHDAYDRWKTIAQERLSRDGRWLSYLLDLERGDDTLKARATAGAAEHTIPRGRDARFSPDGRYLAFLITPEHDSVQAARRAKQRPEDLPKDSLGILDLASGAVTRVERVRAFRVPERAGDWIAYELERPREARAPRDSAARADSGGPKPKPDAEVGYPLVLRRLGTDQERRVADAAGYLFTRKGERIAVAISHRTGETDGVVVIDLAAGGAERRVAGGRGNYRGLAFDDAGVQLAFLTTRDDTATVGARFALYHWRVGQAGEARAAVRGGTGGVPAGWAVSEHRTPSFSRNGGRLFFGTAPWVAPAPEDSTPDDEKVKVDIWHWRDAELQPMQLRRADQTRHRNYLAVLHLPANRVVQLGDTLVTDVTPAEGGDGAFAVGVAEQAYRMRVSWDTPDWRDVYVVDVATGRRRLVLRETQAQPRLSPGGGFLAWWDYGAHRVATYDVRSGTTDTVDIPVPLDDEEHDTPSPASPYGLAGWTAGDRELLVYDRYDVWAVDPRGGRPPRNVTDGAGRRDSIRFRVVDLDPEEGALADELLLAGFDYRTKAAGFARDRVTGSRPPRPLLVMDRRFSTPVKAADADLLLFSRESVSEFPDLWASGPDFSRPVRLTDANPQQAEYRWATVESIAWRGADGTALRGLLYQPADFDSTRKYPLLVNFYERNSDNLHAYHPPLPHRSSIRPTFYASRGYLVFVPDVVYRIGYPGQSALDCVVPGVLELVRRGLVDPDRIGVQGHSWGGYQIAYMVTRTNLFQAAAAGAPVANMTSAYGGIRWESGMSRMFQYERTQSRIGRSLWEAPLRYLENSPLFWADRIATPLLILHNDNDGAVPWYQGIELFTAMRRLGKPAWLVNYNGEPHWPLPYPKRRDWNIRMQQFFDHYLMGAPAPEWLARGVPATRKGATMGLELVTEGR